MAFGLTPRTMFEDLATVQMFDVVAPTFGGREMSLRGRTKPGRDF